MVKELNKKLKNFKFIKTLANIKHTKRPCYKCNKYGHLANKCFKNYYFFYKRK